jgi:hypothetical protein
MLAEHPMRAVGKHVDVNITTKNEINQIKPLPNIISLLTVRSLRREFQTGYIKKRNAIKW